MINLYLSKYFFHPQLKLFVQFVGLASERFHYRIPALHRMEHPQGDCTFLYKSTIVNSLRYAYASSLHTRNLVD